MTTPLLQILRDYLQSTVTTPFNTDWRELFVLSNKHQVAAIVFAQCKSFIPESLIHDFESAYTATIFYYVNRKMMVEKIKTTLSDIEYFTVKGPLVAQFYPNPAFRTMGDTDIVIHTEDRVEVDKRLRGLGLKSKSSFDEREWQYFYNNMEFELHDHLVYSESVNVDTQEQYFNDFWKHISGNELDWNFHFLFLIFHLRKHFMNSGVGFRPFMDIAVLSSQGPTFDWKWIRTELERLDLWPFTQRVFALNEYWFDVPSPVTIAVPSEEFLISATELILKNGIFGFNNEENRDNAIVNAVRGKNGKRIIMVNRAVQGFFPTYTTLKAFPCYSYLKGKSFLLPFAWIHRAFRSIKYRRVRQNMKNVMGSSFTDRETIKRREAIYDQWGL